MDEGVRVALLKLVTEGSLPRAEMSDSWQGNIGRNVCQKYKENFMCGSEGVDRALEPLLTLQSLMLFTTWLYSLLKVCVRRRRHCKTKEMKFYTHFLCLCLI